MLLGLGIYNGNLLDVRFPLALYKKLQGVKPELDDLCEYKPIVGRSLVQILDFEGDNSLFQDTFALTFQIDVSENETFDLNEDGASVIVDKENRLDYVNAYVDYIFTHAIEKQYTAFKQGFFAVCNPRVFKVCVPYAPMITCLAH